MTSSCQPSPTSHPETVTTAFLLSNIHCSSCVDAIKTVVQEACANLVNWVSPNLVTSVLTIEHHPTADISKLEFDLDQAGYEISAIITSTGDFVARPVSHPARGTGTSGRPDPGPSRRGWSSPYKPEAEKLATWDRRNEAHLEKCDECRKSRAYRDDNEEHLTGAPSKLSNPMLSRMANSPAQLDSLAEEVINVTGIDDARPMSKWRATFAVGGMTCAVCVNTITNELNGREGISNVVVSLVTNSVTVECDDEKKVDNILETIEDLGYEPTLDRLASPDQGMQAAQTRTVEILVDGMHCARCPDRVVKSLAGFDRHLTRVDQPGKERSIIKVTYIPDAPVFTVRKLLAAIEASDPAFRASIYHPPTLEERSKQIFRHYQRQLLCRIILTSIVCIPTFIIGVVYMSLAPNGNQAKKFLMAPWTSGISRAQIAMFILATPVYFLAADIFHKRALKEIRALWRRGSKTPIGQRFYRFGSMNTLVALGTTVAYFSSVGQLIAAGAEHPSMANNSNFYFDSVVFLTLFLLVGRLIESSSKAHTGDAVETLGKLRPTTAVLVERSHTQEGEDLVVPAELLEFGDVVRVPQGTSPPSDGIVLQGKSNFDESSLTGESRPVEKTIGDAVHSGTVNKGAAILVQITGVSGKSMLDQIVDVVREGNTKRAPMEQIADTLTAYFVPVMTLIALVTWLVWMVLGLSGKIPSTWFGTRSSDAVSWSLEFATAVLVAACPCGLALAAPTAIFVGGSLAAAHGILAKGGGEAFERASKIGCVVFDKTGTLTMGGEPSVTDYEIFAAGGSDYIPDEPTLLAALKAVEENSTHPIARAISNFCASKSRESTDVNNVNEIPGKGMNATHMGSDTKASFELIVGNEIHMADSGISISPQTAALLQKWKTEAKSIVLVATKRIDTRGEDSPASKYVLAVAMSVSDPIRGEAPAIVRALQARGIAVWLLSGDNPTTATAVARHVGISSDNVIAGVLPTQKSQKIAYLQSALKARVGRAAESTTRRATIAMVGDGINDAPALAQADVGIAIGSGSDVAISSAGFVLLKSDLHSVVDLLDLSRAVFRRIQLNFGWAIVYNCIAVPVAAGCFYPITTSAGSHIRLNPVWASLAMALSSISVVMSSLALRSRIPGLGFRSRRL